MPMHNPPHPGGIVRRQCLESLDLSVTGAAGSLGITHQALSRPFNGRTTITWDCFKRSLHRAFPKMKEQMLFALGDDE